ncbi:MAG: ABC transporter permease, partial [Candidatus Latescibacteria bacterium]|nr:ABC transporter permease [Candidatus Latescibacterota bacterium]
MFKNYLTIAIRNIARHKIYSFINIAGLAIGMACCVLIMLYVHHELSYDTFYTNSDRTYRIMRKVNASEGPTYYPSISAPFAPEFLKDLPEVEAVVRVLGSNAVLWTKYEGKSFYHPAGTHLYADPGFFDVFDFSLAAGDPNTALQEPFSVVITEEMARRYFGSEDALGKVISLDAGRLPGNFTVRGVVHRPENTSMKFDVIVSSNTPSPNAWYQNMWQSWAPSYYIIGIQTYVVLRKGANPEALETKLFNFARQHMDEDTRNRLTYTFQPLTRIYLYTMADYGSLGYEASNFAYGNIQHVYLFSGIACLIMMIACVNFMNLATAQSVRRAREVGLRKVVGASRWQLIQQFLGESLIVVFLALLLAIGVSQAMLPVFNDLIQQT